MSEILSAHGGDLRAFAKKYKISTEEILDFSSNINPLGLPSAVKEIYADGLKELTRYPDPYAAPLCREIAIHFNVRPEQVIAGNGSMEILRSALQVLKPKKVLLVRPCFSEYQAVAESAGAKVENVFLSGQNRFQPDAAGILEELKRTGAEVLMLGQPGNPAGTALSLPELLNFLEEARRLNVFTVLDEAFADWCPEISYLRAPESFGKVLVVRSMTKFYALAGIRSGFGIGEPEFIRRMKQAQGPWTCNGLAQKLSIAALQDEDFRKTALDWFQTESVWFFQELLKLDLMEAFAGSANFFLCKSRADGVIDYLGRRGIYARDCSNYEGLNGSFFRLALRTRLENDRLLEALKTFETEKRIVIAGGAKQSQTRDNLDCFVAENAPRNDK